MITILVQGGRKDLMAKRKGKFNTTSLVLIIILVFALFFTKIFFGDDISDLTGLNGNSVQEGKMLVEFIDVGQGDCTLVTTSDATILIDGGEAGESQGLINYLKNKEIQQIDCCIATHPHSDHIGSLSYIFEEFDVLNVIMPDIPNSLIPTTATYERFLTSISENVSNVIPADAGDTYSYGEMTVEIFGPVKDYDDLNNMSVVCRINYGDTSVMLTGDAEAAAESDILSQKKFGCDADILKVGHHGSKTSNSESWLKAVNPQFAVISCGIDNDYGHPHKQVTKRLDKMGIDYYRTDVLGTISFESDGNNFKLIEESN